MIADTQIPRHQYYW